MRQRNLQRVFGSVSCWFPVPQVFWCHGQVISPGAIRQFLCGREVAVYVRSAWLCVRCLGTIHRPAVDWRVHLPGSRIHGWTACPPNCHRPSHWQCRYRHHHVRLAHRYVVHESDNRNQRATDGNRARVYKSAQSNRSNDDRPAELSLQPNRLHRRLLAHNRVAAVVVGTISGGLLDLCFFADGDFFATVFWN
jgi:hypothetical protein